MTPNRPARPAVVVTGVSSGIGLAIAEGLLERGYRVFGSVRRLDDAEALVKAWGSAFEPLVFDVTDAGALPAIVEKIQRRLLGANLRALINNAGTSLAGPLMHQPIAEVRQLLEINVLGLLSVTQALLPLLGARSNSAAPPGRVVNIGSVSGAFTPPFMGAYAASKHAVEALTQGLRRELQMYGIKVAVIEPSFIRSKLFEKTAATRHEQRYIETDFADAWERFNRSLFEQERRAKGPSVVTRAVIHAIESKRPKTRYPLDPIWHLGRWLPDRAFDQLIFRAIGIERLIRQPRTLGHRQKS